MLRLPPSSPRTYTLFPLTSLYRSWTGVLSPSEKGIMNISASQEAPIVLIVDDDEDVRIALSELMLSVGIEAACFGSTAELLQRSEEHTSELQSLMRNSYAVLCLKKNTHTHTPL